MTKQTSDIDKDCLCGQHCNCLAHENSYNKLREPNQPRRVYHAPKYPDEPLHLGAVFFGFVGIVAICIILYVLSKG